MGSLFRALIRLARAVVEQVISQVTSQVNLVGDAVQSPMQAFVQEVVGGVWTGRGADAFVDSVNSEAMSMLNNVLGNVNQINTNIRGAIDIIEQADQQVRSAVDNLAGLFDGI